MDFKELVKNTKFQWIVFLIITIVISVLFPTHYDLLKKNHNCIYPF